MAEVDLEYKEYWNKVWQTENAPWSSDEKHVWLSKNDNLKALTKGKEGLRILVSLCGDSPDMKWLGDKGHTIIGVDLGKQALEKFLKKHDVEYTEEPLKGCDGTIFKSTDGRYTLYCCNFFEFNKCNEDKVDGVLDSAAIMTIHPDMRKKYAEILADQLKDDGVCIMETVNFTDISWEGPPFKMPDNGVQEAFGIRCNVDKVDSYIYRMGSDGKHSDEQQPNVDDQQPDDDGVCLMPCDIHSITLNKL